MTNGQQPKKMGMRPNIDISYETNGRVKDYAQANELGLSEAYSRVIEAGLADVTDSTGEADQ